MVLLVQRILAVGEVAVVPTQARMFTVWLVLAGLAL
jgi:hypothetical protein